MELDVYFGLLGVVYQKWCEEVCECWNKQWDFRVFWSKLFIFWVLQFLAWFQDFWLFLTFRSDFGETLRSKSVHANSWREIFDGFERRQQGKNEAAEIQHIAENAGESVTGEYAGNTRKRGLSEYAQVLKYHPSRAIFLFFCVNKILIICDGFADS